MLYFSKIKIFFIFFIIITLSFLASSNLSTYDDNFIKKNINLGLDLQGGSYLLLEIDNSPVIVQQLQSKLSSIKKIFKEENIKVKNLKLLANNTIIFHLLDDKKIDKVIDIFENKESEINPYFQRYKSSELEYIRDDLIFQIKFSKYGIINIKNFSQEQALETVRRRIDEVGTNEPTILKSGNDRILVELPGLDDPTRIKSLLGKTANLTFRFVSKTQEDNFGTEKLSFEDGSGDVGVSKRIIISGKNLLDAKPTIDNQTNETAVSFTLDRVGARRFASATSKNIGRRLAIVLDNKVISAPVIQDTISGNGQITGDFNFQTATDLALLLRAGALPAPLNIIEERTVGPDLGQDSINAGLKALLIGFSLVVLFMFFKYKVFGLIANLTLIINLLLLIGILTIFEATLTLPGIAGIILTVGMAVDANVLIFERIKEEKKIEKNSIIAFDSGYNKSKTAVLDANITTLISAIILFFLGSGPIKGFSLTLGVGIFTTLFSVYFFARFLTALYVVKNKFKENLL